MHLRNNKAVIWIIVLFTAFHIFVSATIGLGDDETYYWQWSKHLALSYYDHPPLVAYLVKISTYIFGNNSFGARAFNVLLLPLLSILVYKITNLLYQKPQNSTLAVLLFNILPVFLLGSLLVAPDVAMLFCYVLGLYVFITIVRNNTKNNIRRAHYWYYLGIITGIGLLSKYMMVFIYLAVLIYLIFDKKSSFWFRRKEPYLAFIISCIIFSPVIFWNYTHHWGSFAFQFYGRHNGTLEIKWLTFLSFWGGQVLFASPVFFVAFIIMLYKLLSGKDIVSNNTLQDNQSLRNNNLLLLCFSLPPLIIFGIISLTTDTKPNWAIMSYVPLLILFVGNCSAWIKTRNWGIGTSAVLAIILILQAYFLIIRFNPIKDDMTNDFYGWDNVADIVRQFMQKQKQQTSEKWFIFSYTYQMSSQLAYALNRGFEGNNSLPYPVYSLADHTEEYRFWQDEAELIGKNGLFFMTSFYHIDPTEWYDCADWQPYTTVDVVRVSLVARQVYLYKCINYRGRKRPISIF